jgi:uncharacterized protein
MLADELNSVGCALTPRLLSPAECAEISALYDDAARFRSTVDMARSRYRPGDWNALHRDLYGDLVFPMQVVIGLDRPEVDYTGGEFLMVEQRPRAQSRGTVTMLPQGHGLVFTTRDRPVKSHRGWSASPVRHGVSTVRSGLRHTSGIVLHDAA